MDYFVFDDIDTRDYEGIYVFPSKVDNTPKRVYETKNIVGRDGALYIDQGRYEDVAQTYSIAALTKQVGSEFINALASKVGYFRLSDSFNPTEFYSAVFTSGAEVKIEKEREKNVFSITFTRKPQRWLTSGETATVVANNGTLSNPTLFDSEPLLAVKGYGTIGFNGYEIEIENGALGTIQLASDTQMSSTTSTITLSNVPSLNTADDIYFSGDSVQMPFRCRSLMPSANFVSGTLTSSSNVAETPTITFPSYLHGKDAEINIVADTSTQFAKGTSSTITSTAVFSCVLNDSSTLTVSVSISFAYDGDNEIVVTRSISESGTQASNIRCIYASATIPEVYGDSTKNFLGNPTYIDCEVGECYKYEGGEIVSLNGVISLGSDLPKLAGGTNTFTYDNTITELKVTPRWWKV